jgi:NAD(P)-dependent dehydrogenase (short-subunit alcohol dehydrogenase family)
MEGGMDLGLSGKVAVITGGNTGIGLAIGDALAREGAHLVLCARNAERLATGAAAVRERWGVEVHTIPVDVSLAEDCARIVAEVEGAFGGADILINNAGQGTNETIQDAPDERWQYYWDLHVMAAVRLSRGLAPSMRRRGGGVILNTASICAVQPMSHEPIYNVTKAALMMFSKCLANELIPYGIRVNCVNPGLILTDGWIEPVKKWVEGTETTWQEYLEGVAKQHAPIGRFATPEELAEFYVFLCSARASYCVGSTYFVDGGWLKVAA